MSKNEKKENLNKEELEQTKEVEKDEEHSTEECTDTTCSKHNKEEEKLDLNELKKANEELEKENQKLHHEIALLKLQINELNENYKKQVIEKAQQAQKILNEKQEEIKLKYQNEFDDKKKYAIEKDAAKLIEVINNFDLALKHSPQDPQVKNYVTGFKMILNMFKNLLNDLHINEIEIKPGDEFDHNFMEVLEQIPSDRYKTNQVIEVLRPAYKLHDHVVCFAKVRVAK
ncbi:nucleotide exchange factor GrpE [bacterium]|nr:nucleotide exchange factor GrpE [bacterium]